MTVDEYRAIYKLLAEWLMSGAHFLLTNFSAHEEEANVNGDEPEPQYRRAAVNLLQVRVPGRPDVPGGPDAGRTLLAEQHALLTRYSLHVAREFPETLCRSALHLCAHEPALFAALHRSSSNSDCPLLPPDRYRACVYTCNSRCTSSSSTGSSGASTTPASRSSFGKGVPVEETGDLPASRIIDPTALPPPQYTWISSPERHPVNSDYVNAVLLNSAHFQNACAISYLDKEMLLCETLISPIVRSLLNIP